MKNAANWRLAAACAAVCIAVGASLPASAATFAEGERAYLQQNYQKSLELLTQLARRGHAKAQYLLGRQYQFGQGASRDYVRAYYWYSRAEKAGHVEAGLFRHLLVSKRGMTKAQVADAKKMLAGGGTSTLAAAKKDIPPKPRTPQKQAKAKAVRKRPAPKAVTRKKSPPKTTPARVLARKPVRAAPPRTVVKRARRRPLPYATAVIPNRPVRRRGGWTYPDSYRQQPRNDGYPGWRNRARPRPWAHRGPGWRHPRFQRYRSRPRFDVPRYVYRLPPWQRRQWLRRHRWRVMNDPFYRRAWRAYRRYQHQYRRW